MKKIKALSIILFASVVMLGCAYGRKTDKNICGTDFNFDSRDEIKTSKIFLNSNDGDFFYFYENDYVVFLHQSDVIDFLKKHENTNNYSSFLREISNDFPFEKNVDLRKYSLEYSGFYSISKNIAMNLIESGKAKIIDMRYDEKGRPLKEISIIHLEGGGTWRLACDSGYGLIFEVNDSIE